MYMIKWGDNRMKVHLGMDESAIGFGTPIAPRKPCSVIRRVFIKNCINQRACEEHG